MAQTPSNMVPLGSPAPSFLLPDATTGNLVSIEDFADHGALLVMFICNHCPFVKHLRAALAELGREYQPQGAAIIAISSNDVQKYPDDSPAKMASEAREAGYTFPYLFDESQDVAKSYKAACTPDFFLYDRLRQLVYRGQFDDSRPSNGIPVTGADVRAALDAVLAGEPVSRNQKPSIGCNIKWKPGNEPDYAKG
ncbi:MAG TPA: thioredoxin family protein [Phycisphaerales bacterium]|nr:thioredoxin family protein [Phycisphaerales bacterium]HRQ74879.1 thioredoxin family protein [Phycisphaerales bacterium]